jgi:hypothetical protein
LCADWCGTFGFDSGTPPRTNRCETEGYVTGFADALGTS